MARERAKRRDLHQSVVVIGMGRFGSSLARELMRNGHEVLGVDTDERLVQQMAQELTQAVKADTTDESALIELGIAEFDSAVVAIGADIEASILTTSLLLQLGVENVWAKANSEAHGRILRQLGAHHVIFPEYDMGVRVAHQVSGESLEYVPIDKDFVLVKTYLPDILDGKALAEAKVRATYGVTIVATASTDGGFQIALPDTVLKAGDQVVVAGPKGPLDEFCQFAHTGPTA
ncbi:MAG: potassium channel family protein [Candidatus Nanopelagicales bacterium]